MRTKPLIGLTCSEIPSPVGVWATTIYGQGNAYCEAIIRAGGMPVIFPIIQDEATLRELYEQCDGILFAGGRDLNPALYGQEPRPETGQFSLACDAQEKQLLEWVLADSKPAFFICRGMQLLNVYFGGTLYQHIPAQLPEAQDHEAGSAHQDTAYLAHTLRIEPSSKLATVLRAVEVKANSQHHQAIDTLGSGLVATAWAEDGVIEAVEIPDKPFAIAVQSHPEGVEASAEPTWQRAFTAFVQAASH